MSYHLNIETRRRCGAPLGVLTSLIIMALVILLAGCGEDTPDTPWNGEGVVVDQRYDDPDTWTTQGSCLSYDKNGACTWRAADERHEDGPHWFVLVTERNGRDHLIEVSHSDHDRCRLGAKWIQNRCQG